MSVSPSVRNGHRVETHQGELTPPKGRPEAPDPEKKYVRLAVNGDIALPKYANATECLRGLFNLLAGKKTAEDVQKVLESKEFKDWYAVSDGKYSKKEIDAALEEAKWDPAVHAALGIRSFKKTNTVADVGIAKALEGQMKFVFDGKGKPLVDFLHEKFHDSEGKLFGSK